MHKGQQHIMTYPPTNVPQALQPLPGPPPFPTPDLVAGRRPHPSPWPPQPHPATPPPRLAADAVSKVKCALNIL